MAHPKRRKRPNLAAALPRAASKGVCAGGGSIAERLFPRKFACTRVSVRKRPVVIRDGPSEEHCTGAPEREWRSERPGFRSAVPFVPEIVADAESLAPRQTYVAQQPVVLFRNDRCPGRTCRDQASQRPPHKRPVLCAICPLARRTVSQIINNNSHRTISGVVHPHA